MHYQIRKAAPKDVPYLENLLDDYIRETYQNEWGGTVDLLEQQILNNDVAIDVAEIPSGAIIGFVASINTYDLHYCMKGGEVIDFYVAPSYRGHGAAIFLIINLAAKILKSGGKFLKGGAVENAVVRSFYGRIAMCQSNGECYVSGRAFRHLAGLAEKKLREIIKDLPEESWNYEP